MKIREAARGGPPARHRDVFFPKNASVAHVPFFQARLKVGTPGDRFEREAEAMADQVVQRKPSSGSQDRPAPPVQPPPARDERAARTEEELRRRVGGDEETAQGDLLQADGGTTASVPGSVRQHLEQQRGRGQPLSGDVRQQMEEAFGRDFSGVRVHTNEPARQMNRDLGARAFTHGQDVYFSEGEYRPGTSGGTRLLAHELTHVVQHDKVEAPAIQRDGPVPVTQDEPITDPELLSGNPELRPEDEPMLELVNYAFFYAGGGYGNSARRFFEVFYPDHIRVQAASFEEMFDRMHADLLRHEREGRRVQVAELVIVTHANSAGGLQIPLARDDIRRQRNFTPWDLASLQEEFRDRTQAAFQRRQRFRERRRAVVSRFLSPGTSVVVRGCRFGQSQEGLDALRSFFGGSVHVWAPRGFQGYEVAGIGRSHLQSAEEAFDMLQNQGLIPQDLELSAEEKRLYLQNELGIRGAVPSEFFVMGEDDYRAVRASISQHRALTDEVNAQHVGREGVDLPSQGELWGLSAPSALGRDPELDRLSLEEIERRARILHDSYQPSYAPMLLRLRNAWERHPESQRRFMDAVLNPGGHPEAQDPLFGLPPSSLFGDSNVLAMDAARYRTPPVLDSFEDETLPFAPPVEGAAAANVYEEGPASVDEEALAADRRPPASTAPATAGGGGATQARRQPAASELAAARDFSKRPPAPTAPPRSLTELSEHELGQEYLRALELAERGQTAPLTAVENEIERRLADDEHPSFGLALPRDLPPGQAANTGVEPEVGLRILENVARGEPPFRPELGRVGGVSWFVTEGNPYVGRDLASRVTIEVELVETEGRVVFREPELLEIFERERAALEPEIEADFRRRLGLEESTPLTRKMRRNLARLLERAAEGRMWQRVGEAVRAAPSGVGEVVLENSRFSRGGNGRFGVVADAAKIRLRGGVGRLLETLQRSGVRPDPTITAAAEELAVSQRWAGRVRGAFRYGGRILIVVALANDAYHIYTARDRTRAVISSAGGWAGAIAAGALFAEVWTPADTAGPVAWAVHGIGTLIAGGIGYFVGSETTTTVYELVVDE